MKQSVMLMVSVVNKVIRAILLAVYFSSNIIQSLKPMTSPNCCKVHTQTAFILIQTPPAIPFLILVWVLVYLAYLYHLAANFARYGGYLLLAYSKSTIAWVRNGQSARFCDILNEQCALVTRTKVRRAKLLFDWHNLGYTIWHVEGKSPLMVLYLQAN